MKRPGENITYETRTITLETGIGMNQFFQNVHTMTFKIRKHILPEISKIVQNKRETTRKSSFAKSAKGKVKKFKPTIKPWERR